MQRPVQRNASAESTKRPKPDCIFRFFLDLRYQFIAEQSTGAAQQVLETRNQAPLLVLQLSVHTAFFLGAGTTGMRAIERLLLAGIDAACDSTQHYQHFDLTL